MSAAPCRPVAMRSFTCCGGHRAQRHEPPWSVRGRRLWLCEGPCCPHPKPLPNALGAKSLCVTARVTPGQVSTSIPAIGVLQSEHCSQGNAAKFGIRSSYILHYIVTVTVVRGFYITQASTYS